MVFGRENNSNKMPELSFHHKCKQLSQSSQVKFTELQPVVPVVAGAGKAFCDGSVGGEYRQGGIGFLSENTVGLFPVGRNIYNY